MRRKPVIFILMSFLITVLALWLTAEGLSARFSGVYLTTGGVWQTAAFTLGLSPENLYWPLVWLGLTWIGVLLAVWSGSSWRYSAVLTVGIISLLFLGWGTVISACVLTSALLPPGKELLRDAPG